MQLASLILLGGSLAMIKCLGPVQAYRVVPGSHRAGGARSLRVPRSSHYRYAPERRGWKPHRSLGKRTETVPFENMGYNSPRTHRNQEAQPLVDRATIIDLLDRYQRILREIILLKQQDPRLRKYFPQQDEAEEGPEEAENETQEEGEDMRRETRRSGRNPLRFGRRRR